MNPSSPRWFFVRVLAMLALGIVTLRAEESPTAAPQTAESELSIGERAHLFENGLAADLGERELSVEHRGAVAVHDLTFAANPGDSAAPVAAHLVVPEGVGPFAGVLWVHWLGDPATTNRAEFLDEAVALAPRGMISLLVDAM